MFVTGYLDWFWNDTISERIDLIHRYTSIAYWSSIQNNGGTAYVLWSVKNA